MTAPSDIDGYLQGFRFSDDSAYYDGAGHFYDLAGYDARGGGCDVLIGAPTFSTRNSQRAIALDNTCHLEFLTAIPWEGASLLIYDVEVLNANFTAYALRTGAGSTTQFTYLRLQNISNTLKHRWVTVGAPLIREVTASGAIALGCASSQASRTAFITTDGVTVSESSPVSGTNGSNVSQFTIAAINDLGYKSVIGNLSGVAGATTALTGCKIHLWEAHLFKGNPYVDQASAMAALIASKKAEYGIA
jgi:hypothetical protein